MEDHYQSLCKVVTSRAILSLGVACFKWSEGSSEAVLLTAQVFNVWLLIQQPFTTDPSSAIFLVKHGFDFNKQYSLGLPYTPPSARKNVCTISTYPVGPPHTSLGQEEHTHHQYIPSWSPTHLPRPGRMYAPSVHTQLVSLTYLFQPISTTHLVPYTLWPGRMHYPLGLHIHLPYIIPIST